MQSAQPAWLSPIHFLCLLFAGWINREQLRAIGYLQTELAVLRELHGKKRLRLNDDQRRRLAVKGKTLGRSRLAELATIVTPDTILRWHRLLVARKWDYSSQRKSPGRPPTDQAVTELTVRMARENSTWGYDRIVGALANLGHDVAPNTVKNILKAHGIEPAPKRSKLPRWSEFIKSHLESFAATDFFSVEVWTKNGLMTYFVLFVIDLATRRVEIAGITASPDSAWMCQVARNLTDCEDGFLRGKRYILMDRDGKYSPEFRAVLRHAGVKPLRLPARSPNLNAFAERFVRTIKEECLNRMVFFGEKMLRNAVANFVAHYLAERNHQGLDNRLIEPDAGVGQRIGEIVCRNRLGGLLKYYDRKAA
jgi:putative transposase